MTMCRYIVRYFQANGASQFWIDAWDGVPVTKPMCDYYTEHPQVVLEDHTNRPP